MSEAFLCSICGREHPINERITFDGEELCSGCLELQTTLCRECGQRIWITDNAGSDVHPLCQDCFDDHYTRCSRCGALLRRSSACYEDRDEDEERPYCDSCYQARSDEVIHDYYYKPEPIFYGQGPPVFRRGTGD